MVRPFGRTTNNDESISSYIYLSTIRYGSIPWNHPTWFKV